MAVLRHVWPQKEIITYCSAANAAVHADSIRRLAHECFPSEFAAGEDSEDEDEDIVQTLCGLHELEQSYFIFCRSPGPAEVVAFALLFRYDSALYVSTLCVTRACRRRGLGSKVMRSASSLAASMGLPSLTGSIDASAMHLSRFYERLGATARPSGAGPGAVTYTRRLDAPSGPATAAGVTSPMRETAYLAAPPPSCIESASGRFRTCRWITLLVAFAVAGFVPFLV